MQEVFKGLFDADTSFLIAPADLMLCIGCSLLCGIILTACYMVRNTYTRSFAATLAMLPAAVCVVILMVNGNVGAGVAVAGAFSLVRFRSVPGTAREICAIFLAMGTGLVAGMGYLGYAVLISVILGLVSLVFNSMPKKPNLNKTLRITVPEHLEHSEVFEPILRNYTKRFELIQVKTTNMGSLYRLTYNLTLKDERQQKELIDQLRCRNGNLEISLSKQDMTVTEL